MFGVDAFGFRALPVTLGADALGHGDLTVGGWVGEEGGAALRPYGSVWNKTGWEGVLMW